MRQVEARLDAGERSAGTRARHPAAAWALIAALAVVVANGSFVRGLLGTLQESVGRELHLSDLHMSLVQGLASAIAVVAMAVPLGNIVDHRARAPLMFGTAAAIAGSALATAFSPGFWTLFLARMVSAAGALGALQIAISLTADLSESRSRGKALLLLSLAISLGNAAAFGVGGTLSGAIGTLPCARCYLLVDSPWRGVYVIAAVWVTLTSLVLLPLREPARRELGAVATGLAQTLRAFRANGVFLGALFATQVAVLMADTAALVWATPVLAREHGLSPEQIARPMAAVIFLAGAVGAVIGGVLADAGHRMRRRGGVFMVAIGAAALSIPACGFSIANDFNLFVLLLGLLLLCGAVMGIVATTAVAVLVPNEMRATCMGAMLVVSAIGGFGIAPSIVPLVASAVPGVTLGSVLAVVNATMSAISLIAFAVAMRRAPRDVDDFLAKLTPAEAHG